MRLPCCTNCRRKINLFALFVKTGPWYEAARLAAAAPIRRKLMMRSTLRWLVLPVLFLSVVSPFKTAASATLPPEYDWLLKNVCANASNTPVAADPYYGCPAGSTERDIQIAEPLPYLNHDQPRAGQPNGFQRRDAYPVLDKAGNPL